MTDDVQVSWQGTQQLVSLTNDQYLNLSEASGFTCAGQLANTGAFSGFLGVFKGTYEEALEAVTGSLDQALTGAKALSDRIADVRELLHRTDQGVSELHTRLEASVSCQPYTPGDGGGDIPQVPDNVVNLNNLLDVDTPMNGPRPPDWVPDASTGDPLDLVDNTASLVDNASGMGDGLDHAEDADDYVEENRR
jgi:hypothetical protein